ncbi:hypothetical protein NRIC_22640 [Enterococcus florum]|uniref:DUF3788 domain-containing protein n=1 Tax=Enterococcus florum TaxID=2480627 RepID=A0A4P5PMA3_9ENTE|nr:DUF3788 domain-containing protein [Enterococcus florum]GCF94373.1 hypothetical protein NRIC_22640 [Enterococcus florum]
MKWCQRFAKEQQPTFLEMTEFIQNPLWKTFHQYLQAAYETQPQFAYSGCSMRPGWNVKYSKAGKSLCTLYPETGRFTALIVVGRKEMPQAEEILPVLTLETQELFRQTKTGQGAKWLMLSIHSVSMLEDAVKLISLRRKPKHQINMEDCINENRQNNALSAAGQTRSLCAEND